MYGVYLNLSNDVVSGSEIRPCSSGLLIYGKCYDVHNKVTYIMTKLKRFFSRNEISK